MADTTLATVIQRLEAATIRLEEIVKTKGVSETSRSVDAPTAAAPATDTKVSPALAAFDEIISGSLKAFVDLAGVVGGLVADQVLLAEHNELVCVCDQLTDAVISCSGCCCAPCICCPTLIY
jgi:hypothetical protein